MVNPPVGVLTHVPLSIVEPSEQAVVATTDELDGGAVLVTPPVGPLGTHFPFLSSSVSLHVGGVG